MFFHFLLAVRNIFFHYIHYYVVDHPLQKLMRDAFVTEGPTYRDGYSG